MPPPVEIPAEFPAPLQCLFQPKRYKVLWGGRGAGRSWGIARALLILGTQAPERVLCARELQKSIAESVHKLLADQVVNLRMQDLYEVQVGKIMGREGTSAQGTSFVFEGIKNNTTKIKSFEGLTRCWVEEANKVSKNSWNDLVPTIRTPGSEIWISFNPELETDYTYRRFVREANPAMSFVVKMTWRDNPWFPEELRAEMEDLRKRDYDAYLNVWEGHCLQVLEGAVYAKELRRAQEEGRVCRVPWDRSVPVDTFWDLGRADATAIWFAQRVAMQVRVLRYYAASGEDIGHFLRELQSSGFVYGTHHLPHDAKAKRLGSKLTIEEQVRTIGRVKIVPKLSPVDGINAARLIFPSCWFDEDECEEGLNALRHYRYKVLDGQRSNEPLHDWASDGADAFRYMAVALKRAGDRPSAASKLRKAVNRFTESAPGLGWMR